VVSSPVVNAPAGYPGSTRWLPLPMSSVSAPRSLCMVGWTTAPACRGCYSKLYPRQGLRISWGVFFPSWYFYLFGIRNGHFPLKQPLGISVTILRLLALPLAAATALVVSCGGSQVRSFRVGCVQIFGVLKGPFIPSVLLATPWVGVVGFGRK
jgi:hypothetical protein